MTERPETIGFCRKRLPHWEVVGGRYFVTIRLKGSIPSQGIERIRAIQRNLAEVADADGQLEARRKTFVEMEKWLDCAPQVAHLCNKGVAKMIVEAIHDREERGIWRPICYTIMPNHLHLFVSFDGECVEAEEVMRQRQLVPALEAFKRRTTREAADILGMPGRGFWQREWFDHWSRGPEHDERIVRYVRNNAVKAGLVAEPSDWPWWWQRPAQDHKE